MSGNARERPLTLAVTSGKGGVGKTTTAANLALALAKIGRSVTLIDGDVGLANLDILLGISPTKTLEHFFCGGTPLEEIVHEGPLGIGVVPAGSGLPELTRLGALDLIRFSEELGRLRRRSDVLLIDTAAGIGDHVASMVALSDRALVVTWPEPTALVDAYAAIKVIRARNAAQPIGLVVNGVEPGAGADDRARRTFERIDTAAERFLGHGIELEGYVVEDPAVVDSVRRQSAAVLSQPLCPASRCFERLALRVASHTGSSLRGATESSPEVPMEVLH